MSSFLQIALILAVITLPVLCSDKPGSCNSTSDCSTGSCISVENNIPGVELSSQCTIDPVCSGSIVGSCPTFSSWPETYQQIQPVCAFVTPKNCAIEGNGSTSSNSTVDCFTKEITKDNTTSFVLGIYACQDISLYSSQNGGFFEEVTKAQLEACKGNSTDSLLCNGQGTCSPKNMNSSDFQCVCNLGFNETSNCLDAVSNACNNNGQCGEGGVCDLDKRECQCNSGVTGFQCSECESDEGCNNNGVCSSGVCTCETGYTGVFCSEGDVPNDDSTSGANNAQYLTSTMGTILILSYRLRLIL